MKVSSKTYTVAAVFSLAIALLAVFSISQIGTVKNAFTNYSHLAVAIEKQVLTMTADTNFISRLNRSIILGGQYDKDFQALQSRVERIYSHYDALNVIAAKWPDTKGKQSLQTLIASAYQSTKVTLDKSLTLMASLSDESSSEQRNAAWTEYAEFISPLQQESRVNFQALSGFVNEQGVKIYNTSVETVEYFGNVIIVASVMAILLGASISMLIARSITAPLQKLTHVAKEVANTDTLYLRSNLVSQDELGTVGRAVDSLLANFEATISSIKLAAVEQTELALHLAQNSSSTSKSVNDQQHQTQMVAAAMTEMASSATEIARNAADTACAAQRANTQSRTGQDIVEKTISNINSLAGEIHENANIIERVSTGIGEISRILDVIGSIAEQTNLLALNAAIEAARAGEQGRGFAVVADEVRTLASRTNKSTQEIKEMIDSLQNGFKDAVKAMANSQEQADLTVLTANDANSALSDITLAVSEINDMATHIATAAEQQTLVNEEISVSINNITLASDETAIQALSTQQASEKLSGLAANLRQQVAVFKCQA